VNIFRTMLHHVAQIRAGNMRPGTRGTGKTQRRVMRALDELGQATTAELVELAYPGAPRRHRLLRARSTRAALHAIGATVIDRLYKGGNVWALGGSIRGRVS
jgi:hypothetical protein